MYLFVTNKDNSKCAIFYKLRSNSWIATDVWDRSKINYANYTTPQPTIFIQIWVIKGWSFKYRRFFRTKEEAITKCFDRIFNLYHTQLVDAERIAELENNKKGE